MASDGYYALYDYPKEMTTDTAGTFKMSKIDMTTNDVTYSFKYDFICDGVTTSKTVATGLTATQYTWTPTTATFVPLMTKSDQGTLKVLSHLVHFNMLVIQSLIIKQLPILLHLHLQSTFQDYMVLVRQ